MPNTPYKVFIIPFRKQDFKNFKYMLFRKKSEKYWQYIDGIGKSNILPIKVAKRSAFKKICIPIVTDYFLLKTIVLFPAHFIADYIDYYDKGQYVIPGYYFAVDCTHIEITLSSDDVEYMWIDFEQGCGLLQADSDKTAFWELNERLVNDDLPQSL